MLRRYQHLSVWLRPMQPAFMIVALLSAGWFAYLLVWAEPEVSLQWSLIAVSLSILGLMLWLIIQLFSVPLPLISNDANWRQRLTTRFKRGAYHIVALTITAMLIASLILGTRALSGIIQKVFF